jgi:hypothetical protein
MKIKYKGEIRGGKLTIYNRQDFLKAVENIGELDITLAIEKRSKKRSNNQNKYLWSVVYPCVKQGLLDLGHVLNIEEVHEFCKSKFNSRVLVDEDTGEVLGSFGGSTTELDTFDFNQYFEAIIRWSAEYLGVEIPYPNEQVTLDF